MCLTRTLSLFAAIVFVSSGCIYENQDTYIDPIQPPDGSDAAITLNALQGSTIFKPVTVNFTVQPSGKQHYEAQIKSGSNTVYQNTSSTGQFSFLLDPAKFSNGENSLEIEVAYPSLSPSLAGRLGAEIMYFRAEIRFHVDLVPPQQLAAPLVYIEDGKSMVEWQSPAKFNFAELVVLRTYYKNDYDVLARDSLKIRDLTTTKFHDAWYVGGLVRYRVDIKGHKFYIPGKETVFNVTPLQVSVDSLVSPPVVSWDRSPLYNNSIKLIYNSSFPPDQPGSVPVYTRFGQPSYANAIIQVRSVESPSYSTHTYEIRKRVALGIPLPPFFKVAYVASLHAYFLLDDRDQKLYRVNDQTYEVTGMLSTASYGSNWVVSQNGLYAYLYANDKLSRVDLNSMYIAEQINLTTIVGVNNQGISHQPVLSDDNRIAFALGGTLNKYVVNLNTRTVEWMQPGQSWTAPHISPDGKYVHMAGTVYVKAKGNWDTVLGSLPVDNILRLQFTGEKLFVFRGSTLGIAFVDLVAPPDAEGFLQQISTPSFVADHFSYDHHSNALMLIKLYPGVTYLGQAYVYDLGTFEQTRYLDNIYEVNRTHYVNGHYFHGSGAVLP